MYKKWLYPLASINRLNRAAPTVPILGLRSGYFLYSSTQSLNPSHRALHPGYKYPHGWRAYQGYGTLRQIRYTGYPP